MTNQSPRTFGIELEGGNLRYTEIVSIIRKQGYEATYEDYNHNVPTRWKVTTDASISRLSNPYEIVSPPIPFTKEGLEQVSKIVSALQAAGMEVNPTCGLHVHVDVGDFKYQEMANLVNQYLNLEPWLDSLFPTWRKNTFYAASMAGQKTYSGYLDLKDSTKATEFKEKVLDVFHKRKYWKINLGPVVRQGTVEFRQHEGTFDPNWVCAWIEFCMIFVESCKMKNKTETYQEIIPLEELPAEQKAQFLEENASERKNAITKKFQILCELLDKNDGNLVTDAILAEESGLAVISLASYMLKIKKIAEVNIYRKRAEGYCYFSAEHDNKSLSTLFNPNKVEIQEIEMKRPRRTLTREIQFFEPLTQEKVTAMLSPKAKRVFAQRFGLFCNTEMAQSVFGLRQAT